MTRRLGLKRTRAPKYSNNVHASDVDQHIVTANGTEVSPTTGVDLAPAPKRRGRGPGLMRPVPKLGEIKPEVWPVAPDAFDCTESVFQLVTTIRRLTCINLSGPHRSYNEFDPLVREDILKQFLERYQWRSNEEHNKCRVVFDRVAAKRYCDELCDRRDDCIDAHGNNFAKWKEMVPYWCNTPQHWYDLCDIWSSTDWQYLSAKNKENRSGTGQLVHHHAGSKPVYKHREQMVMSQS
ncbi:Plant transposase (Ptta/En/Spm family) [Carex littledalei]|uniref:Plant transposase (Ptta/En/Spm family) n=1 Tax=Carex littledalei TaxID=544730 RepID=A0A833REG3_9POAL|nr:Plant transposase (Ptta/En/Spm family) [Carex littledalei]